MRIMQMRAGRGNKGRHTLRTRNSGFSGLIVGWLHRDVAEKS